jgi:cytochrome P450
VNRVTAPSPGREALSILDPAVRPDPYPLYARLRAQAPLRLGSDPVVLLASHADCAELLRHPLASVDRAKATLRVGRAALRELMPQVPRVLHEPAFLFRDAPDHTRLRRLVAKAFTTRVVQRLAPRIAELVDAALDRAGETGAFDVVADLSYPLPMTVICELLGVPVADEAQFRTWSALLAGTLDPVYALTGQRPENIGEQIEAAVAVHEYFERLVAQRRGGDGEDLLSALIAARDAGDQLSTGELVSTCVLLLLAGHETTTNLIANGVLALLRHPAELAALRADPGRGAAVVEEVLRYDPPVHLVARVAAGPLRCGGADGGMEIAGGDLVLALLGAAQRDPAEYPDPDRFDSGREARHLAFATGAHFCLGAPLARLEARLALARFAQRVDGPRLVCDPPPYKDTAALRGPSALPVEFDAIRRL